MRDVNKVILIGRLGADPIQRLTKSGLPVVSFSVATARSQGKGSKQLEFSVTDDKDTEEVEQNTPEVTAEAKTAETKKETQWHRCVAWGKQGVTCAQFLRKGSRVYVEGSVRSRKFMTESGDARYVTEVHANEVSFLNSPKKMQ